MKDKFLGHKEFRVMYVGKENLINELKQEFFRAGGKCISKEHPDSISISPQILRKASPIAQSFPGATVKFYKDIYELAQFLPQFDADLVIIDERNIEKKEAPIFEESTSLTENVLRLEDSTNQKQQKNEITFENLQEAIQKFTPRSFHYTTRRIIVVLPKSAQKSNREYKLGLANVRGVITDPSNSIELFLYATKQLFEFRKDHKKTSLCVSGGGLEGYLYSIGVINAIDDCLIDKTCCDFDVFCGVSSGAIVTASLACGIQSEDLVDQAHNKNKKWDRFGLNMIFDPAAKEIARKAMNALTAFSSLDFGTVLSNLQNCVPAGFFKGEKLRSYLEKQILKTGSKDRFEDISKELYISVTDQDTGENIVMGEKPWTDIKISQAVRASTALPPFYLPEKINGHWFIDGQVTSSSDFNVAINKGAGLVLYIDPMIAYTSNQPGELMKKGGYYILIQALKSIIYSRSSSMLQHSMDSHPDVDFIIFRPTDQVMEALAGNPMKYAIRTELIDLGYKCTIKQIVASYHAISHKLAKHGFALKPLEEIKRKGNIH